MYSYVCVYIYIYICVCVCVTLVCSFALCLICSLARSAHCLCEYDNNKWDVFTTMRKFTNVSL